MGGEEKKGRREERGREEREWKGGNGRKSGKTAERRNRGRRNRNIYPHIRDTYSQGVFRKTTEDNGRQRKATEDKCVREAMRDQAHQESKKSTKAAQQETEPIGKGKGFPGIVSDSLSKMLVPLLPEAPGRLHYYPSFLEVRVTAARLSSLCLWALEMAG